MVWARYKLYLAMMQFRVQVKMNKEPTNLIAELFKRLVDKGILEHHSISLDLAREVCTITARAIVHNEAYGRTGIEQERLLEFHRQVIACGLPEISPFCKSWLL